MPDMGSAITLIPDIYGSTITLIPDMGSAITLIPDIYGSAITLINVLSRINDCFVCGTLICLMADDEGHSAQN